jgi:hypothetical protein
LYLTSGFFAPIFDANKMYIRPIAMVKEELLLYEYRKATASVTMTLAASELRTRRLQFDRRQNGPPAMGM